jgi:hypothetical protein
VIAATVAASRELICGCYVIENFGDQISTDVHIDHLVILRLQDFRMAGYYATATVHLPAFQMGRRPRMGDGKSLQLGFHSGPHDGTE